MKTRTLSRRGDPAGRSAVREAVFLSAFLAAAAAAPAQVLQGTGDPSIDVAAVQAAVDGHDVVLLEGAFSFASGAPGPMVTIRRDVRIEGVPDGQGQIPKITGGTNPFVIAAPGAEVAIEGLHFENSVTTAIWIQAAGDVSIANCVFEGVLTGLVGTTKVGIEIFETGGPVGAVRIVGNDLKPGGGPTNDANGIILNARTDAIEIIGNRVANTTAHGIDLRNVGGSALVARNEIVTGRVGRGGGPGQFVDGIRCIGAGSYVIEHNSVDAGFENAAGIRLGGTAQAVVHANEVVLSMPDAAVPGAWSAGIQVQGTASRNEIVQNQVRGRGRAAFSVIHSDFALDKGSGSGNPVETSLFGNSEEDFAAAFASVEIGAGALDTDVFGGSGTLSDRGTGTVSHGGFELLP
ncbi:MAG TPA: right-handed parallel beta-helix repeat-containing protein [Thermoanaerobaculia bacterium]|nr:right-handed parallel beta-helix repeat-containing protein [Thermoanaerobaculia bacterium]